MIQGTWNIWHGKSYFMLFLSIYQFHNGETILEYNSANYGQLNRMHKSNHVGENASLGLHFAFYSSHKRTRTWATDCTAFPVTHNQFRYGGAIVFTMSLFSPYT